MRCHTSPEATREEHLRSLSSSGEAEIQTPPVHGRRSATKVGGFGTVHKSNDSVCMDRIEADLEYPRMWTRHARHLECARQRPRLCIICDIQACLDFGA